jgi:hypothetical protein
MIKRCNICGFETSDININHCPKCRNYLKKITPVERWMRGNGEKRCTICDFITNDISINQCPRCCYNLKRLTTMENWICNIKLKRDENGRHKYYLNSFIRGNKKCNVCGFETDDILINNCVRCGTQLKKPSFLERGSEDTIDVECKGCGYGQCVHQDSSDGEHDFICPACGLQFSLRFGNP